MHFSPVKGLVRTLPIDLPDNEPYLILPESLALDLRKSPLAIGIYLLIARAFLIYQAPIPLSATDIASYDGRSNLLRSAIKRALDQLGSKGYLLPHPGSRQGVKGIYTPGWGYVNGTPRPWSFEAAGLDRPRSVRALRVPRSLIDIAMGRIIPHMHYAAIIERYVTQPPISLFDLGAYGLSWAGFSITTPALMRLGLVNESGPLPPPTWPMLLARISQQPLFDTDPDAPRLSPRGLKQAGFQINTATPSDDSSPLFFVPPDMIGDMIPPMIGDMIPPMIAVSDSEDGSLSAAESDKTRFQKSSRATTGTQGNQGLSGKKATSAATTTDSASSSWSINTKITNAQSQPSTCCAEQTPQNVAPAGTIAPPPNTITPSELLLRDLGVYPSVARHYREFAINLIERAHTIAQRLSGRRSIAATIAQLLREEHASPGWLRQGRPDLFLSPMREETSDVDDQDAPAEENDEDPCARAHTLLSDALEGHPSIFIDRLSIAWNAGRIVVVVPSFFSPTERADLHMVLDTVTDQLGIPVVMPMEELPPPEPAPIPERITPDHMLVKPSASKHERPDWINPEQWGQLHLIARGALSGSHWVDGEIIGSGPGTTRILRGNLAGLVGRLCGGAGG